MDHVVPAQVEVEGGEGLSGAIRCRRLILGRAEEKQADIVIPVRVLAAPMGQTAEGLYLSQQIRLA